MKGKVTLFNKKKGTGRIKNDQRESIHFQLDKGIEAGFSENDFAIGNSFTFEVTQIGGELHIKSFAKKIKKAVLTSLNINYNLFLNKPNHLYIENILKDNAFKLEHRKEKIETKSSKNPKGFQFFSTEENEAKFLKDLQKRNIGNAKLLLGDKNIDTSIHLKPDWRLALGIGGASVYETSITLHHVYGIPYLPASAIKGIVRSWIITDYFGSESQVPKEEDEYPLLNAEYRAYQNDSFCKFFGCPSDCEKIEFENGEPIFEMKKGKKEYKTTHFDVALKNKKGKGEENKGKITFFDAFPTDKINISLDIMNVHYKEYYNSKSNEDGTYKKGYVSPPADWSTPNIINFLTVQETYFQFIIGSKNDNNLSNLKIDDKTIVEWLKEALTQKGIGAKTAVGYGYMSE